MKNIALLTGLLALTLLVTAVAGCTDNNPQPESQIIYRQVNKQYVLIRDMQTLLQSNDEVSAHVDSIISGLLNEQFISTGHKNFDLNADSLPDIGFEIINLHLFNPNGLPASFDTLAARVIPHTVEILDNSTYGYPDALEHNTPIAASGNWGSQTSVLGTFLNAGQFQGKGEKYLAIRLPAQNDYRYGWVKLYCSQHNDTLRIIEYAYNNIPNSGIAAGQTE